MGQTSSIKLVSQGYTACGGWGNVREDHPFKRSGYSIEAVKADSDYTCVDNFLPKEKLHLFCIYKSTYNQFSKTNGYQILDSILIKSKNTEEISITSNEISSWVSRKSFIILVEKKCNGKVDDSKCEQPLCSILQAWAFDPGTEKFKRLHTKKLYRRLEGTYSD